MVLGFFLLLISEASDLSVFLKFLTYKNKHFNIDIYRWIELYLELLSELHLDWYNVIICTFWLIRIQLNCYKY